MNVVHLVSNRVWGGGERYVLDLARAQRADGHRVAVITRNREAVRKPFAADGLLGGTMRLGGAWDVLSQVHLARFLRRMPEGRTVVHTHNFKDAATALAARRLCLGRAADIRVICTRHLVKPASLSRSNLRTYADLDAIIFVSELARREFMSTAPGGIDPARLHVIHNAIPAADSPGKESRPTNPDAPVNMIFAGRITPEKGLDTLLRALAELPVSLPWHLEICGTGMSREVMPLVRLSRGLGLENRITWAGHVPDVREHMRRADLCVAPTRAREAFGLTVLEAFHCGLPVVTTDNGAQSEIMTDGNEGLLVPPGDTTALARALERLVSDAALRASMSRAALDTARHHNYTFFYNKISDVYNERR